MSTSREPELVALRRLAEDLAKRRGERATSGHMLAAIASKPSAAADLLKERRLDSEVLLKAARVVTDDASDAIVRAVQRARDFAARSGAREPTAMHLLFALCHERLTAAHRAIEQCGIDVGKLRVAAMQVAMGIAPPRREVRLAPTTLGSSTMMRPMIPHQPHQPHQPMLPMAP